MVRIIALVTLLLALAGCVVPFQDSTGPSDNRSPYFSNRGDPEGPPQSGAQIIYGQQPLGIR
jgi:hypothetical protein